MSSEKLRLKVLDVVQETGDAASIVYQVVNGNNGQVIEQFPDSATLQRRAYFRALDLSKDQPSGRLSTDMKA